MHAAQLSPGKLSRSFSRDKILTRLFKSGEEARARRGSKKVVSIMKKVKSGGECEGAAESLGPGEVTEEKEKEGRGD